jgi:signal transduction histidine kinase
VATCDGPGERVGLSSMRERITLLGGSFGIHSEPGGGTEVVAEVPLPEVERMASVKDESYGE